MSKTTRIHISMGVMIAALIVSASSFFFVWDLFHYKGTDPMAWVDTIAGFTLLGIGKIILHSARYVLHPHDRAIVLQAEKM